MQSSKLINYFKSLNKKEVKEFVSFTRSEYFNKNMHLAKFAQILAELHPDFPEQSIEKETIFKKLFPHTAFDESKSRYLMSDLTILLEQFMRVNHLQNETFLQDFFLLQALDRRKLDKFYLQQLEVIKIAIEKSNFRDSEFYFRKYLVEENAYDFTSQRRNRSIDVSLQEVVDNLEINFLSKSLKYYCEMLNRTNILSVSYNTTFFSTILNFLQNGIFNDIPAIKIYLAIYQSLLDDDNQENYYELLQHLDLYGHLFSTKEQRDMYVFAQNYCIRRINRGFSNALEQMYDLFKKMVEKNLIYEGKYLSQPDYKNIVTTGLRLGQTDWVEQFIDKFRNELNPEYAENAYIYSMAWVHFTKNEYDKALRMLLKVEFNDVYYHLDSKSLLLKVYYQMNEYDAFFSLIDAFRIYLKRNKFISEMQRNTYQNFVNACNKLMKLKLKEQKPERDVVESLLSAKPMADTIWLSAQAEKLITLN